MRILAVHDVGPPKPWAQYRHSSGLAKYAPEGIEVTTVDSGTYERFSPEQLRQFDAVYVISLYSALRRPGINRLVSCVASHAWKYPALDRANWRTFGVNPWRNSELGRKRLAGLDAVICRNEELGRWAGQWHKSVDVQPIGIDRAIFSPVCRKKIGETLRIGWCAQTGGITNFKGHDEILVPLMNRTKGRYGWTVSTAHYKKALTTEQMVEWYRSLDVYLSTSSDDATPNGPFEAAACGVPVISTGVGCVTDWTAIHEARLAVPGYGNEQEAEITRRAIVGVLRRLCDPAERRRCREILLQSIADVYDYAKIAPVTLRFIAGDSTCPES